MKQKFDFSVNTKAQAKMKHVCLCVCVYIYIYIYIYIHTQNTFILKLLQTQKTIRKGILRKHRLRKSLYLGL